jgi:hypothetical protein
MAFMVIVVIIVIVVNFNEIYERIHVKQV